MALSKLLAQMIDKDGRIAVPGFYDDVAKLSAYERKQMARVPFSEAKYKKLLGVKALFGEKGFTPNEHRAARPTFEINGLTSGYQGEGSKTIVPSHASAKITMRLVPHQDAAKILRLVARHLKSLCPPTMRMTVELGHVADPYIVSPTGRLAKAALKSLKSAFGHEPVLLREGGSIRSWSTSRASSRSTPTCLASHCRTTTCIRRMKKWTSRCSRGHPDERQSLDRFRRGVVSDQSKTKRLAKREPRALPS